MKKTLISLCVNVVGILACLVGVDTITHGVNFLRIGGLGTGGCFAIVSGVLFCIGGVLTIGLALYLGEDEDEPKQEASDEAMPTDVGQVFEDCSTIESVGAGDYQLIEINPVEQTLKFRLVGEYVKEDGRFDLVEEAPEEICISTRCADDVPALSLGDVFHIDVYYAQRRYIARLDYQGKSRFLFILKWVENI